jgi:hypothetical protein
VRAARPARRADRIGTDLGPTQDYDLPIQNGTLEMNWPTLLYSNQCMGSADLVVWREDSESQTMRVTLVRDQVTPVEVRLVPK